MEKIVILCTEAGQIKEPQTLNEYESIMNQYLSKEDKITADQVAFAGISIATLTGSGLFEKARLAEQESKINKKNKKN